MAMSAAGSAAVSGRVKRILDNGCCFIEQTDGPDVFFHKSNVVGRYALQEGDEVQFEMGVNMRGRNRGKPCANQVRLLGLSGDEAEWFGAVERDDADAIRGLASKQQNAALLNAICRELQHCRRCGGSGEGQGGYSGRDVEVSRRRWLCGECGGDGRVAPMSTAVVMAVTRGKPNALEALITLRADVNKQRPLKSAALMGDASMVDMLLKAGADPNVVLTVDYDEDYSDEVEHVLLENFRRAPPGIRETIRECKAPVELSLHIVPDEVLHAAGKVKLRFLYLSGEDIVPAHEFRMSDEPISIWEHIAATKPMYKRSIRMIMPDSVPPNRHVTHSTVANEKVSMQEFLWPSSAPQQNPLPACTD